jgi:hypothetical protein
LICARLRANCCRSCSRSSRRKSAGQLSLRNSGGQSSGWTFDQLTMGVPRRLARAISWSTNPYRPLSDPDLYLRELGVVNLHPLVEESLQEAVTCFRHDLYAPCLAMLTRSVEGEWTEMGLAIADVARPINAKRADALSSDLVDPQYSLARRLTRVGDVYDQKELCETIWSTSGVRPRDVRARWRPEPTRSAIRATCCCGAAKPRARHMIGDAVKTCWSFSGCCSR